MKKLDIQKLEKIKQEALLSLESTRKKFLKNNNIKEEKDLNFPHEGLRKPLRGPLK